MIAQAPPSLSVIMPNYNHGVYLAEAVRAINAQSWQPIELIIVDDGSTDRSLTVLRELQRSEPNLRVIWNGSNGGAVSAINQGLAVACGQYVYLGAADDLVLPGFFASAMSMLARHGSTGICSGLSTLVDRDGRDLGTYRMPIPCSSACYLPPTAARSLLNRRGSWFLGNTTIFNRDLLMSVGGLHPELGSFSDGFASLVLTLVAGACFVPRRFAAWRRMEGGLASQTSTDLQLAEEIVTHARALLETEYWQLADREFCDVWESRWRFGIGVSALLDDNKVSTSAVASFLPGLEEEDVRRLNWLRTRGQIGRSMALMLLYMRLRPSEVVQLPLRRAGDAARVWRSRLADWFARDEAVSQVSRDLTVIIGSLGIGGAESQLLRVLPGLVIRGWSVTVLTLADEGELAGAMRVRGVSVRAPTGGRLVAHLPRPARSVLALPFAVVHLWRELRARRGGILNFVLPKAYVIGMVVATLCRSDGVLVMSRRSLNRYQRRNPFLSWIEKLLHRRVDLAVANNATAGEELAKEGIPAGRIKLVQNGVDLRRFATLPERRAARKSLYLPEDAFVIAVVANLIPYKGHRVLLDALAVVRHELPTVWRLLCVGRDGGIGPGLREDSQRLGLENNVVWLGLRHDIPELLAAADLGVLPSLEEGMPNAVLEYMAATLPVVVTDVGGAREVVEPGVTGVLVPPEDSGALGRAIADIAADVARCAAMGTAGRRRAEAHFGMERCIDAYDRLFESILELGVERQARS